MRTLAEVAGEEEEVSGGVVLKAEGVTAVIALCFVVEVRVGVSVQVLWEIFVAAVKLVGKALRVVQEVRVWLVYL